MTKKHVAVVLSGCGHLDGSEVTEAVSSLIALSELGVQVKCFAPDTDFQVQNHLVDTANAEANNGETRQVLAESARIARGHIAPLATLRAADFDAVVFPGGFGAAKVLSNWAARGAKCEVLPDVVRIIHEFHNDGKPIGAICIAPAIIAKVLGSEQITLTVGNDSETIGEISQTGAQHVVCKVTDYISDRDHKILTTPAYMYDAQPHEVFTGVRAMIKELVEMA